MQDEQGGGEVGDKGPVGAGAAPLPKVVGAAAGRGREGVLERLVRVCWERAVGQGNVQQQDLHDDGEQGLHEQRGAEVRAEPVEDPACGGQWLLCRRELAVRGETTHLRMLATSMISGMSSEKPAELRVLWIE